MNFEKFSSNLVQISKLFLDDFSELVLQGRKAHLKEDQIELLQQKYIEAHIRLALKSVKIPVNVKARILMKVIEKLDADDLEKG